jgi:hypothetical protein
MRHRVPDVKRSKRKLIVLCSLVSILCFTSALLLGLAPPPLGADGYPSLSATADNSLDIIFNTRSPQQPGRWKYIYIHQSATSGGDARTLAGADRSGEIPDHFVIGNGNGLSDGEIQVGPKWNDQAPAQPPAGADRLDPDCISVCLVGNFDQSQPTPTQIRRLGQLVQALQDQCRISSEGLVLITDTQAANDPAAIGRNFPADGFRSLILQ